MYFRHRESEIGGLLYYDITDGFGPEIYVLGSGPAGTYRLTLIYFAGKTPSVSGTLTVLTDAGTSREKRQDIPWTLDGADSQKQVEVGSFVLD